MRYRISFITVYLVAWDLVLATTFLSSDRTPFFKYADIRVIHESSTRVSWIRLLPRKLKNVLRHSTPHSKGIEHWRVRALAIMFFDLGTWATSNFMN